ncbi:MAG TPA: aconitase/3-isopropylmalate dehydratase large subunit family protein [Candidatus Acidoferrales bacterium]|nr:aconitase/3-isopropylmalate dehydratase large subunit family protein [Candidatus Acidoferrales bacterium]
MHGKTIAEKILSRKSGRDARAGDVVVCPVDCALGTDGSTPMALNYFHAMNGSCVAAPEKIVFALDHYAPAPSRATAQLHEQMRAFANKHGIHLWEVGEGIGHQLIVESGRALPGSLVVGADSHAVTYGALNCFATGIGSSDLAAILISGKMWLRVPETIRVNLMGELRPHIYPKDIALSIAGELGADGANYQSLEFSGSGLDTLDLEDRLVLCNLVVEMGAKNGTVPTDGKTLEYLASRTSESFEPVSADPDAVYSRDISISLSDLVPQIAFPHQTDKVESLESSSRTPVQMVYLGTCTGGRVKDFHQARDILTSGGGVAPGVQLVVTPASREVLETISRDGTLSDFISLGAVIQTPGCGSCCGTCGAIPADGANVISTANRNFKGRMGNSNALIYLASPASCAAAAVRGEITDPRAMGK